MSPVSKPPQRMLQPLGTRNKQNVHVTSNLQGKKFATPVTKEKEVATEIGPEGPRVAYSPYYNPFYTFVQCLIDGWHLHPRSPTAHICSQKTRGNSLLVYSVLGAVASCRFEFFAHLKLSCELNRRKPETTGRKTMIMAVKE